MKAQKSGFKIVSITVAVIFFMTNMGWSMPGFCLRPLALYERETQPQVKRLTKAERLDVYRAHLVLGEEVTIKRAMEILEKEHGLRGKFHYSTVARDLQELVKTSKNPVIVKELAKRGSERRKNYYYAKKPEPADIVRPKVKQAGVLDKLARRFRAVVAPIIIGMTLAMSPARVGESTLNSELPQKPAAVVVAKEKPVAAPMPKKLSEPVLLAQLPQKQPERQQIQPPRLRRQAASDKAAIVKDIRKQQARALKAQGEGLSIGPTLNKRDIRYYEKLSELGWVHPNNWRFGLEEAHVNSTEALKVAEAQQRILGILADCQKGVITREEAFRRLLEAIDGPDGYFDRALARLDKLVAVYDERKKAEEEEAKRTPEYIMPGELDYWENQRIPERAQFAQLERTRRIFKALVELGMPLPLSEILHLGGDVGKVWAALPPMSNPNPVTGQGRQNAGNKIKNSIMEIIDEEIKAIRAHVAVGEYERKREERVMQAGVLDRITYGYIAAKQTGREVASDARMQTLEALRKRLAAKEGQEVLDILPFIRGQRGATAASEELLQRAAKRDIDSIADYQRSRGPGTMSLETDLSRAHGIAFISEINHRLNAVAGEIDEKYRSMGWSVSIPRSLAGGGGFLGLAQAAEVQPIKLDRPPSAQEVQKAANEISRLQSYRLKQERLKALSLASNRIRIAVDEMYSGENRKSERERIKMMAIDELIALGESWPVSHDLVQRRVIVLETAEDMLDLLRLAKAERLEAEAMDRENFLMFMPEGTPDYQQVRKNYEDAVMAALRARVDRTAKRLGQISSRINTMWSIAGEAIKYGMTPEDYVKNYFGETLKEKDQAMLDEALVLYEQLDAIERIFGNIRRLGLPIGSPHFVPGRALNIDDVAELSRPPRCLAAIRGHISKILETGEERLIPVMSPGEMPLGDVRYIGSCNKRFGVGTTYIRQGDGKYIPTSHITEVSADRGIFDPLDPNSYGETFVETQGPHPDLQMASRRYWVVGMKGFDTMHEDEQPMLLGSDPKNPDLDIVAQHVYGVDEELRLVKIGVVVRRAKRPPAGQLNYAFEPDIRDDGRYVETEEGFSYGKFKGDDNIIDELGPGKRKMVRMRKYEDAEGMPTRWELKLLDVEEEPEEQKQPQPKSQELQEGQKTNRHMYGV